MTQEQEQDQPQEPAPEVEPAPESVVSGEPFVYRSTVANLRRFLEVHQDEEEVVISENVMTVAGRRF